MGYTFYVGPELEYFYFQDPNGTQRLDEGGYFRHDTLDVATDSDEKQFLLWRRWA